MYLLTTVGRGSLSDQCDSRHLFLRCINEGRPTVIQGSFTCASGAKSGLHPFVLAGKAMRFQNGCREIAQDWPGHQTQTARGNH